MFTDFPFSSWLVTGMPQRMTGIWARDGCQKQRSGATWTPGLFESKGLCVPLVSYHNPYRALLSHLVENPLSGRPCAWPAWTPDERNT